MDAATRANERAAATGDHEAQARAVALHLRAGRRDPRRDPQPGDMVCKGDDVRLVAVRGHVPMRNWGHPPNWMTSPWDAVVFAMKRERRSEARFIDERCPAIVLAVQEWATLTGVPLADSWEVVTGKRRSAWCSSILVASWRRWAKGGTVLRIGESSTPT